MIFRIERNLFSLFSILILLLGYLFSSGLNILDGEYVKIYTRIIPLVFALLLITLDNKLNKNFIYLLILIFVAFILNRNVYLLNLIYIIFIVYSFSKISTKDLSVIFLISNLLVCTVHLILLYTGYIGDHITQYGERQRSTLGFSNPNQLAIVYLSLVFSAVFFALKFQKKLSYILVFLLISISLPIIEISDSRNSKYTLYILIFFSIIWLIFRKKSIFEPFMRRLSIITVIFSIALSFYLATNSNDYLNTQLSFRPYFFNQFMVSTHWLGYAFGWNVNSEGVDNFYLILFSCFGIVFYLAFLRYLFLSFSRMDVNILPISITLLISSIFESFLIRPEISLSILFFLVTSRTYLKR